MLLNEFKINATDDEYKSTPMHWASYNNDAAMIRLLLKHGANANARTSHGSTPLHVAVDWSCEAAIEALSESSDLEIRDDEGRTGERALNHCCCLLYCG